jgi:hypothetical protein
MRSHWLKTTVLLTVSMIGANAAPSQKLLDEQEQAEFFASDASVKNPVELPNEVMDILRVDHQIRSQLHYANMSPASLPASWFSASYASVGLGSRDIIVEGQPPMRHSFWIFAYEGGRYRLILSTVADDLTVKEKRSDGYKDLVTNITAQGTRTTIYLEFDGSQYVQSGFNSEKVK